MGATGMGRHKHFFLVNVTLPERSEVVKTFTPECCSGVGGSALIDTATDINEKEMFVSTHARCTHELGQRLVQSCYCVKSA